jgi:pyruvate/2-oxoglutarate dehydrogenase complex dihydrolipoamide dehydrogenase (E3) component
MLGGGSVAIEMAQFYARMGSRVTLIARSARLARREDEDVSSSLHEILAADGVEFRLAAVVESVRPVPGGVAITLAGRGRKETLAASHLFVATGRRPNTDDLGLETIGLAPRSDGTLAVDERLATPIPGVWAAGDVRGGAMYTHTSWDDHRVLHSQLTGSGERTTRRIVPYAIFTDPELGRVGLGEADARARGGDVRVLRYDMKRSSRARELGASRGFIKVVLENGSDTILGAAVLAAAGAELVHLYVELMNAGAGASVIRDAVHIHPTLAEAVQSAVTF